MGTRLVILLCGYAYLASPGLLQATAPGVPSIASTSADYVDYAETSLPPWFSNPVMQANDNTPVDNPITNDGAELGRVLFYDPRLSHNDGTACASCHTQSNGFSDTAVLSEGFEGGLTGRHSMGLANARYYQNGRFFWDERAATLEDQVLGPIQDTVEMGSNLTDLVSELNQTEYYPALFQRAFGDSTVTSDRMAKAMAQFVRAMVSYQSPFDEAIAAGGVGGSPNFAAIASISDPALVEDGHVQFEQDCSGCHRTQAQIADRTHNIGLDATNTDDGAGDGEFKVPSLRNIADRGRYMHDGRFETLEEVIEFYSTGIENNPDLANVLAPGGFGYTTYEKESLLAFLETLSDSTFLTSDLFSDPFVTLDGDYNGDGVVDMDDYTVWSSDYGMADGDVSGPLWADGNGDGLVDAADYSLWRDNLGARWDDGITLSALSEAVPEPSTLLLLAIASSVAATRRTRLRSRPLPL